LKNNIKRGKMYAHIKKCNIIIFVVLSFSIVPVQSVQGMNEEKKQEYLQKKQLRLK
jgi:hypothetical protein